jgi:hypothetical protein
MSHSAICTTPTSPPAHCRFQVDLVPAHSVLWLFLQENLHAALDPIYNAAVKREIDKVVAAIPRDQLAIQFDVASAVFARIERVDASSYGRSKAEMQDNFSRILIDLGNHVPAVVEPSDMADMVELANRLTQAMARPIELIHMPVPRDRDDDGYFAPLRALKLKPETELSLGLVHHTDGIVGTRKRMATAQKYVKDFSVATECGFGRRPPETIPELLRIHAAAADL